MTHEYAKGRESLIANPHFLSPSLVADFLDRIHPLHDVLGPVLFQFEYLNRQKMASRQGFLDAFGTFAKSLPEVFTYGLEIWNPRYIDDSFFGFLSDTGVVPVLLSGYWMPSLIDVCQQHQDDLEQHDAVFRLMGPDRKRIEEETGGTWDRIIDPHDEELDALARVLRSLTNAGRHPFLFINNHYEGSAPLTISRFIDCLAASETPASRDP